MRENNRCERMTIFDELYHFIELNSTMMTKQCARYWKTYN